MIQNNFLKLLLYFFCLISSNHQISAEEVLDQVKDKEGVAICVGVWSAHAASYFHHVLMIDAENEFPCANATFCEKSIDRSGSKAHTITFKQLIHDYIYQNETLIDRKIRFIKCDIQGKEEHLIEDILHFAYYNQVKVHLSFHLDEWKTKSINNFEYLFKFFNSDCSEQNLCQYLEQNPSASILFAPLENAGDLVKNNITAVVIGYNQLTYIRNMVSQLEKYTSDIVIIDNDSQFQPLLDYYETDYQYTLLRQSTNFGHKVYKKETIANLLGGIFLLTDPDLQFHPNLPDDFIKTLLDISETFESGKVGFALFINSDEIRTDIHHNGQTIQEWEKQFWEQKIDYLPQPNLEMYQAPVDTTFCLVNRKYMERRRGFGMGKRNCIRVAGHFTCLHIPWHKNFHEQLEKGEYEAFLENNTFSHWYKIN